MRITFLPHDLERMAEYEGTANLGRRYAQKILGHRRIRVVYNQGTDEAVVVTVMLRRREGSGS